MAASEKPELSNTGGQSFGEIVQRLKKANEPKQYPYLIFLLLHGRRPHHLARFLSIGFTLPTAVKWAGQG